MVRITMQEEPDTIPITFREFLVGRIKTCHGPEL